MHNHVLLMILHLIGNFYLQSDNAHINDKCSISIKCKESGILNLKSFLIQSFIYVIPFLLLFFHINTKTATIITLVLLITHIIIDTITCFFKKKAKVTVIFLLEQAAHFIILHFIYKYFNFEIFSSEYSVPIKVTFIVLLLMAPCSILINKLMEDTFPKSVSPGLFDVGSIIGILERLLVVIFAHLGDLSTIAIIITVKTWARTNDLKCPEFRNRYLLGTLASLVSATLVFMLYGIL